MRFWLIKAGEPLPLDSSEDRLLRTGMLGRELVSRGHSVVWWSATFDHFRKVNLRDSACDVEVSPGFRLSLLHAPGYRRNISLQRIRHHRGLAKAFAERIETESPPDAILCSMPTIEFCRVATAYGMRLRIPVVLDMRDSWPDIYLELLPAPLRPFARPFLEPMYSSLRKAIRSAYAVS